MLSYQLKCVQLITRPRFSAGISYRLTNSLEKDDLYHLRHKLFFDLSASSPVNNLDLTARLRLQRMTQEYIKNPDDKLAKYTLRSKIKAEYDFTTSPIDPYIYAEAFFPLIKGNGLELTKSRLAAGADLKITGKSSIQAGLIIEHDTRPSIINSKILSISYSLKF
jgi:hypothetical protein